MAAAADEETPLLEKLGGTGSLAAWVCPETKEEQEKILEQYKAPKIWMLVMMNAAMALGYSAYVLTSWLYATIMHQTMFPPCVFVPLQDTSWDTWYTPGCKLAVLCFWGLPLVAIFVVLGLFYRNCIQMQLYYTLAAHRVHLDYTDGSFFSSISIQCIAVVLLIGLTTYGYYDWTMHALITRVKFTIPFWIPIGSFAGVLYSAWDVETQLVSLAKVVQTDLDWVKQEMPKTYLIRDFIARKAWDNIKDKLTHNDTSSWVKALVQECDRIEKAGGAEHKELMLVSYLGSHYWVTEFLYNSRIKEERHDTFHWWFRFFKVFAVFMSFVALYFMSCTFFTVFQGLFRELLGPAAWWLSVGPFVATDKEMGASSHVVSTTAMQAVRHSVATFTTTFMPKDGDMGMVFAHGH